MLSTQTRFGKVSNSSSTICTSYTQAPGTYPLSQTTCSQLLLELKSVCGGGGRLSSLNLIHRDENPYDGDSKEVAGRNASPE